VLLLLLVFVTEKSFAVCGGFFIYEWREFVENARESCFISKKMYDEEDMECGCVGDVWSGDDGGHVGAGAGV